MGVDITIGNLYLISEGDDSFDDECGPQYHIKRIDNNLSTNPPSVENTNYFHTSYIDWSNLCEIMNTPQLNEFEGDKVKGFFDKKHLEWINDLVNKFEHKYPQIVVRRNQIISNGLDEDRAYFRLLWLKYWIEWSLQNCEMPCITIY